MALAFVNPPPAGGAGDYTHLLNFGLSQTVTLEWQNLDALADLWLFKDDENYLCAEFNLAKTFCAIILRKSAMYF